MKDEKNIEEFTAFVMNEIDKDVPSHDFVMNVMKSVEVENEKSRLIIYKPLIPKSVWVLIIVLFLALTVYVFTGSTLNFYLISTLDINVLNELSEIDLFKHINFSRTFTLSFILFSVLVLVQLFVIKTYFNKQNVV